MKSILQKLLAILAKLTLARYAPRVVAITGSVGKTSTKEAVAHVLKTKFSVRANVGNYNNEIGLPLTIIGQESGNKNPVLWLIVFFKTLINLIYADYPRILVLELGTDKPGDIAYLARLLGRIEIGVVTDIGISHLEFFSTQAEIAKEKLSLIKSLDRRSLAVLNFDNPRVLDGQNSTKAEVCGIGFSESAQIIISDYQLIRVEEKLGVNFKLHSRGTVVPFFLPNALGKPVTYAAAIAAACALRFNMNLVNVSEALKTFKPPKGRLRLIPGLNQTVILDDTYNASPDSTNASLEVLREVADKRKVAVLGGMEELGAKTESGHREVAGKIIENKIDEVFLAGEKTKTIQNELKAKGFSGIVTWSEDSVKTGALVKSQLQTGDTVLVKGSQAARMEKVVKEIMAEPKKASDLLVRQTGKWLNK